MAYATNFVPGSLQWWGLGRELTAGTLVAPVISIPLAKGEPDDKPSILLDKGVRGSMGVDYGAVLGTEIADFPLSGDVYPDTIGYLVHNAMGDYQAVGSSPSSATTVSAASTAGATSFTVAAIGSIVVGSILQYGNATLGTAPTENLIVSGVAGSVVTFASTPLRFSHSSSAAVAIVSAPFTHTFSLLNSGNGQPPTHTVTYHNDLAASTLARQYGYWCCSGIDFKMSAADLFTHDTKGTSVIGVIDGSTPTNTQSGVAVVPAWQFKVGVGGPATGGTLLNNVEDATVSIARELKPLYTLQGAQGPYLIARLGLSVTGKFTFMAQDESPLIALLAGTIQQLQLAMTSGSGAGLTAVTFNFQNAIYETAQIDAPDVLTYDVGFRGLANSTNAGASGGLSPASITIENAVGSY